MEEKNIRKILREMRAIDPSLVDKWKKKGYKQLRTKHIHKKIGCFIDFLLLIFKPYPFYRKPQKLLLAHGIATLGTLALFPPATEVPPIAIPIVFASSFCVAYILTALRIF
jgi:hypothetical protein